MEQDQYKVPILAKLFHKLPHLNITLHYVNSTFIPDSETYLESLGILGSLPAAWLILTLFILLIYLCTRCCDRKPRPKHSISVLKWTLSIFTLLCCGAVGVGLYGNDDVHNAIEQFEVSLNAVDFIVSAVKNQTGTIESTLQLKVKPLLAELSDVFDEPITNLTARALLINSLTAVTGNTSSTLISSQEISRPLQGVNLKHTIYFVHLVETIRYPATMAVLSILLVFCVILLFGVARHSRCCLITFSVFGLFAVIVSWLLTSVYLATSVALGDLCVAPEEFLRYESPATLQAEVLKYYVRCEPSRSNPFTQRLREAQRGVDAMTANIGIVTKLADPLYHKNDLHPRLDIVTRDINLTDRLVSGLAALLDCRPLHKQYLIAARSVCDLGLYGLSFMLLASLAAGLIFTVLVWVDSHTWIYIRKRRDYLQVDEQDPFLPPSAASQAIAARTLRNQGSYKTTTTTTVTTSTLPSPRNVVEPSPRMSHRYSTTYNPIPFSLNPPETGNKDFQNYLRENSKSNIYYEPAEPPVVTKSKVDQVICQTELALKETKDEIDKTLDAVTKDLDELTTQSYGYYSLIPGNHSNLTNQHRALNYNNREDETLNSPSSSSYSHYEALRPISSWSNPYYRSTYTDRSTLESPWSPGHDEEQERGRTFQTKNL